MMYMIFFLYCWLLGLILYTNYNYVRIMSFFYFMSFYLLSLYLLLILNKSIMWYQIMYKFYTMNYLYISYIIGIDNMSMSLMLLCALSLFFVFYYIDI